MPPCATASLPVLICVYRGGGFNVVLHRQRRRPQGGTFDFVSPGGQTDIFYDPPGERGTIEDLSGSDLMVDGKTTSLDEFAGQVVAHQPVGTVVRHGPHHCPHRLITNDLPGELVERSGLAVDHQIGHAPERSSMVPRSPGGS